MITSLFYRYHTTPKLLVISFFPVRDIFSGVSVGRKHRILG